ncbi:uroporphyrinogen-III synthase [Stenotrophomonas maltophilia]|nr:MULTISPECIES: uroporphyrinogen-III synthase [Stenotrophomonas]MDH0106533.1 uroporphyrinogen-III synthase [Stenotrophomonas maltophilia]MDH0333552.1 uroporphyrinogen-III synthase [Stenotrophomonas maltophilia]MDH0644467.1 uroporphyrinogen-III synthase [Stenotrophomonas maltophilia]MDH0653365.1 uroporphyrinogen-III synthase [Stenotrophomonas maltophilia]MDH0723986.1 uroporphyrinogen-III synthase [Stenotrophomonas maltophilia]
MQAMADHTIPTGAAGSEPGWTFISLRPQGQNSALRRAVAGLGGHVVALPPWRLQRLNGMPVVRQLQRALNCDRVVFTSPAAVAAAASLLPLAEAHRSPWLTVGEGTARALRAQGVGEVHAPQRMDSEGLLALPVLAEARGLRIGLVTAPGGRGLITAHLQAAGATIERADVYQRRLLRLSPRTLARLAHSAQPWVLAVSSGEALLHFWQQLPPALQQRLQAQATVVVASERLGDQAHALGLQRVVRAAGPTTAQLVAAAHATLTVPAAT